MIAPPQGSEAKRLAARIGKGGVQVLLSFFLLLYSLAFASAQSQQLSAHITVLSLSPARVRVEGQYPTGATSWSFRNQYATASGLGERVENLVVSDDSGAQVPLRKISAGEFSSASPATRFAYEVRLEPPLQMSDAVYASWLTAERGLLLPGDLLPRFTHGRETEQSAIRLRFTLPQTWSVAANETAQASGEFEVASADRAVFLAGPGLRRNHLRVGSMDFFYVTSGTWAFTDEDVQSLAASILKEHTEVMGGTPRQSAMLILSPFPRSVGADRWSAETRGSTVTLLSGQAPSRTAALAQLSVPLTHELFHLWVPNGLALDGEYDWFYEGFTSYQAMRAAVRLNLLTFQDYLNALGRTFDAYTASSARDQPSLIEASEQRWRGLNALVYHKGLLVAFLYDWTLRLQTKNSRSLEDVYRELFRRHRTSSPRADGNASVLSVLKSQSGMQAFVEQYVEGARAIDLRSSIAPFGLEIFSGGVRTHLIVSAALSRTQRDLLRKFGYNEETQRRR